MLTEEELHNLHTIYWSHEDNLYRREKGGSSEFGFRTNDIFDDNIYMFPERYIPSRVNEEGKHKIYTVIDGNVCICGCSLCNKLYVMRHIETGKELAVGSSCITKAKGHLTAKFKKYEDYDDDKQIVEISKIKKSYDEFENYLKDLGKRRCNKCYDLVYTQNRKPNKKNITKDDYVNTNAPAYCYKCDDKYEDNFKCKNCNDRLVLDINTEWEDFKYKFCSMCANGELKYYFNINYDEKDKYKQKYRIKWDSTVKKWYQITTIKKLNDNLRKIIHSISKI